MLKQNNSAMCISFTACIDVPVIEIAFTESSFKSIFRVRIDGKANTIEGSVMRISDKTSIGEDMSFQLLDVLADQIECLISIQKCKLSTLYPVGVAC